MDEIISRTSERTGIDQVTVKKVVRLFLANFDRAIYMQRNITLLRQIILYNMEVEKGDSPEINKQKQKRYWYRGKHY